MDEREKEDRFFESAMASEEMLLTIDYKRKDKDAVGTDNIKEIYWTNELCYYNLK